MKKEITKGEILDWIQYGILHDSLESELKDGILAKFGIDEDMTKKDIILHTK